MLSWKYELGIQSHIEVFRTYFIDLSILTYVVGITYQYMHQLDELPKQIYDSRTIIFPVTFLKHQAVRLGSELGPRSISTLSHTGPLSFSRDRVVSGLK
jgi:hypothetical protein